MRKLRKGSSVRPARKREGSIRGRDRLRGHPAEASDGLSCASGPAEGSPATTAADRLEGWLDRGGIEIAALASVAVPRRARRRSRGSCGHTEEHDHADVSLYWLCSDSLHDAQDRVLEVTPLRSILGFSLHERRGGAQARAVGMPPSWPAAPLKSSPQLKTAAPARLLRETAAAAASARRSSASTIEPARLKSTWSRISGNGVAAESKSGASPEGR